MDMILREATPLDAADIVGLVNRAYRPSFENGGWTHERDLVAGNRTEREQLLSLFRPLSKILVLCQADVIIACVHLLHNDDSTTDIGMLATEPNFQTRGLGKRMLLEAEQYAAGHFSTTMFRLCVLLARPELIAFYQRRGYQQTGEAEDYPIDAGVGQPRIDGLQIITLTKPAKCLAEDRSLL
jgi:ribosomal protein S18 acetylase RimI-like enzyme